MIGDLENEIFSRTKTAILAAVPGVDVKGEVEDRPATFPFVSMVQIDNPAYAQTATFDSPINHMAPAFEIQVFTNGTGKKTKAKTIMQAALGFLCGGEGVGLGFQLVSDGPITNAADANIHRRVARVQGVIGNDKLIYWR
jgi:hypothetical protein